MKNYRIKKLLLLAILATSMQINAETKEVQIKIKDNNIESLQTSDHGMGCGKGYYAIIIVGNSINVLF